MHEIDVALTDYLLVVEALYFAWASRRLVIHRHWFIVLFLGLALSAGLGGTFHGFFPEKTASPGGFALWFCTLSALGVTSVVMWNLVIDIAKKPWRRAARAAAVLAGIAYISYIIFIDRSFFVAMIFYAVPLFTLGIIHRCFRVPIAIILLGSVLQVFEVGLQPIRLSHNGLYHLVQFVAIALMFQQIRWNFAQSPART